MKTQKYEAYTPIISSYLHYFLFGMLLLFLLNSLMLSVNQVLINFQRYSGTFIKQNKTKSKLVDTIILSVVSWSVISESLHVVDLISSYYKPLTTIYYLLTSHFTFIVKSPSQPYLLDLCSVFPYQILPPYSRTCHLVLQSIDYTFFSLSKIYVMEHELNLILPLPIQNVYNETQCIKILKTGNSQTLRTCLQLFIYSKLRSRG